MRITNLKYMVMASLVITILLFHGTAFGKSNASENSFRQPDFAFPVTVINNAEIILKKKASPQEKILAAIQIINAKEKISKANFDSNISMLDSIAQTSDPRTKAVIEILEANLYANKYERYRWKYSNRKLSTDSIPTSSDEWSAEIFASKILALTKSAASDKEILMSTPLADWKEILDSFNQETAAYFPTLYHFIACRGIKSLSLFANTHKSEEVIPFFNVAESASPYSQCNIEIAKLRDELYSYGTSHNDAAAVASALAIIYNSGAPEDFQALLHSDFQRFTQSPYSSDILHLYALDFTNKDLSKKSKESKEQLLQQLNNQIAKFPDYARIDLLRQDVDALTHPMCVISNPSQILSDTPLSVNVVTENIDYPVYISVYKVSEDVYTSGRYNPKGYLKKGNGVSYIKSVAVKNPTIFFAPDTCYVDLGTLPKGYYFITTSKKEGGKISDLISADYVSTLLVSDITSYNLALPDNSAFIYAVSANNGKPIDKAEVTFTETSGNKEKRIATFFTGRDGYAKVPDAQKYSWKSFSIKKDGNSCPPSSFGDPGDHIQTRHTETYVSILTNLSIYHPGDTVKFACIVNEYDGREVHPVKQKSVKVVLRNPAYTPIDTLQLKTDDAGRAYYKYKLPTSGITGEYSLSMSDSLYYIDSTYFKVEEYVAPSFYVDLAASAPTYSVGDSIKISGNVRTYSGMPLSQASVTLKVGFSNYPWWRSNYTENEYIAHVVTDNTGHFNLSLPTANLKGTKFENGNYSVVAQATSLAGETQSSTQIRFTVGQNESSISLKAGNGIILLTDKSSPAISAIVRNQSGQPVPTELSYRLKDDASGKEVMTGNFISPNLTLDAEKIPSGKYVLQVFFPGDTASMQTTSVVFYRADDTAPPYPTELWVPEDKIVFTPSDKEVVITVGSSYPDSYILCSLTEENGYNYTKWLTIDNENRSIKIDTTPLRGETIVNFTTTRNCTPFGQSCTLIPEASVENLKVEAICFRDSIYSGGKENWRFRYTFLNKPECKIPVLATMSDKALDRLNPFTWRLNYSKPYPFYSLVILRKNPTERCWINFPRYKINGEFKTIPALWNLAPKFITYSLQHRDEDAIIAVAYGTATRESLAVNSTYAASEKKMGNIVEVVKFETDDAVAADTGASEIAGDDVSLRETEFPSAFFMPDLFTDKEGEVEISFDVPNYNTTWKLQLLGYNEDMKTSISTYEIVASKPIMVQSHLPRFLRSGDKAYINATIFNNTSESREGTAVIELFDPLSEKIITTYSQPFEISPSGNDIIGLELSVPDSYDFIGCRVIAKSDNYSDGEQALVRILPSSAPVIDSYPFYMAPAQDTLTLTVPLNAKHQNATFQYCANPIWYCVTALPEIAFPDSDNIIALTSAYTANTISSALVQRHPEIGDAIKLWSDEDDSILTSNLNKYPELKIAALENTPWTANADAETLRMHRLKLLLDSTDNSANSEKLLLRIAKLQNSDGGWSWCENMPSSSFITMSVLYEFAMLKGMGMLPDNQAVNKMIERALAYVDNETMLYYNKNKRIESYSLLNLLYIKSFFKEHHSSKKLDELQKKALKDLSTRWESFDIADMATTATLLNRSGYPMQARTILEALKQQASSTPDKGMWFDNLRSGWNGATRLITTAKALEAFHEISPQSPEIDKLRQWLLIQRQANDWGKDSRIAEVIYAILTSGSNWTSADTATRITINGREIHPSETERLTGTISLPIYPSEADKEIEISISRAGHHPSWGGVITTGFEEINQIKPQSSGEISIKKEVFLINQSGDKTLLQPTTASNLRQGSPVRVQLTLTSKRDIDYVMVRDSRSGCIVPDIQTSSYVWQDGTGYYREMRNAETNFYFTTLRKGVYIITYDCHIDRQGEYSLGTATVQSLYAPVISAHSGGKVLQVQ